MFGDDAKTVYTQKIETMIPVNSLYSMKTFQVPISCRNLLCTKPHALASSTHCDRIGGGLEMWPVHRLRTILVDGDMPIHNEFPNSMEIVNHEDFQKIVQKCPVREFPSLEPSMF